MYLLGYLSTEAEQFGGAEQKASLRNFMQSDRLIFLRFIKSERRFYTLLLVNISQFLRFARSLRCSGQAGHLLNFCN
jgi:hypothetical protein